MFGTHSRTNLQHCRIRVVICYIVEASAVKITAVKSFIVQASAVFITAVKSFIAQAPDGQGRSRAKHPVE
jgi:hypothetical protein